jgi:hypothetical protein
VNARIADIFLLFVYKKKKKKRKEKIEKISINNKLHPNGLYKKKLMNCDILQGLPRYSGVQTIYQIRQDTVLVTGQYCLEMMSHVKIGNRGNA